MTSLGAGVSPSKRLSAFGVKDLAHTSGIIKTMPGLVCRLYLGSVQELGFGLSSR